MKITIYVVDDEWMAIQYFQYLMERTNIEYELVGQSTNSMKALKEIISLKPDAVFMDINMPVMDGLEATRRIRSMNRRDAMTIPIVAMSANAFQEDVEKSLAAGLNEHLTKPLDEKKLTETMKKYLGNKMR